MSPSLPALVLIALAAASPARAESPCAARENGNLAFDQELADLRDCRLPQDAYEGLVGSLADLPACAAELRTLKAGCDARHAALPAPPPAADRTGRDRATSRDANALAQALLADPRPAEDAPGSGAVLASGPGGPRPAASAPVPTPARAKRGLDAASVPPPGLEDALIGREAYVDSLVAPIHRDLPLGSKAYYALEELNKRSQAQTPDGRLTPAQARANYEKVFGPQGSPLNGEIQRQGRDFAQAQEKELNGMGLNLLALTPIPGSACPIAAFDDATGWQKHLNDGGCAASLIPGMGLVGATLKVGARGAEQAGFFARLFSFLYKTEEAGAEANRVIRVGTGALKGVNITVKGEKLALALRAAKPFEALKLGEVRQAGMLLYPSQNMANPSIVAEYALLMKSGAWDWSRGARIELQLGPKGEKVVTEGTHRVLAAQLAGVKIPASAFVTVKTAKPRVPFDWARMGWMGR